MIVNTAAIQHRALRGEPPPRYHSISEIASRMAKIVPELAKLADTINPDGQNQPAASAIAMLQTIAPDVPRRRRRAGPATRSHAGAFRPRHRRRPGPL
jgi:hypothetical protein